jgi:hypothetical protein
VGGLGLGCVGLGGVWAISESLMIFILLVLGSCIFAASAGSSPPSLLVVLLSQAPKGGESSGSNHVSPWKHYTNNPVS